MKNLKFFFPSLACIVFLLLSANGHCQNFDSSRVLLSSPSFDYRNPQFDKSLSVVNYFIRDCIFAYEKWSSDSNSNIAACFMKYDTLINTVEITNDNYLNNHVSVAYFDNLSENNEGAVVYQSKQNGLWKIYFTRYDGSSWSQPTALISGLSNEPQPDIDAYLHFNSKRYSLTFVRNGDIIALNYSNGVWGQEFNLTSEDSAHCHSPKISVDDNSANYNFVRTAYLRIQNDTVNSIAYNRNWLYDNGKFTVGVQKHVQQDNTQENMNFALNLQALIYDYDTLGKKCVYVVVNYNDGDEFINLTQWFPGNNSRGTVSMHGDITTDGFYYSGFCWVSRQEDSMFVYSMNPSLNWSGPKRFYAGHSSENISVNLSTKLIHGINNMYRLRAIWEKRINGRVAFVESFMDDRLSSLVQSGVSYPGSFTLHQNYPNPFNPVTRIRFGIPGVTIGNSQSVKLTVHNTAGEQVRLLINEKLSAGNYEIEFDGSELASGVYFYTLNSGMYTETRRMILLK